METYYLCILLFPKIVGKFHNMNFYVCDLFQLKHLKLMF